MSRYWSYISMIVTYQLKKTSLLTSSVPTFAARNLQGIYQQAQEHASQLSAPWRADYHFSGDVSKLCMESTHDNQTKKSPLHRLDFQYPWLSF